jgi:hypothetical protein
VSVTVDTATVEQHHSVISGIAGHLGLNLAVEGTSTGAVVADARLVIFISIRVIIVVHNKLGVGVHEQAGQQGPMGTNSLLLTLGSLNDGTVISPHTLWSDNSSRIEGTGVCSSIAILTSY